MHNLHLNFKFEVFEGPLDLLLNLIEKNKIDIFDIPISFLLEQYLKYMDTAASYNVDLSAEFIEAAARLIYIKSKLLLPKAPDEPDPREELVGELIEYQKVRQLAAFLSDQYEIFNDRFSKPPDMPIPEPEENVYEASVLLEMLTFLLTTTPKSKLPPPITAVTNITNRKIIPLQGRLIYMMRKLYTRDQAAFTDLLDYATPDHTDEIVVIFIAVTELLNKARVHISGENLMECQIVLNRTRS